MTVPGSPTDEALAALELVADSTAAWLGLTAAR